MERYDFLEEYDGISRWEDKLEIEIFKKRETFLFCEIDDDSARNFISKLHILNAIDSTTIRIYLNSPGGGIYAGLAIHDAIQKSRAPISITCIGLAASMASLILVCGAKGERSAYQNSRIMIHEGSEQFREKLYNSKLKVESKELDELERIYAMLFAKYTNQPLEKIKQDILKTTYMSAEEAREYGIIDEII